MVKQPCEAIKEKTISSLSMEDQKIIEAILMAVVNEDSLSRGKLIEVLLDTTPGNVGIILLFLCF